MFRQQSALRLRQGDARPGSDVCAKRQLLRERKLARRAASVRLDPGIAGQPPPDQRLVDLGDTHFEGHGRLPHGHAAIDRANHTIRKKESPTIPIIMKML